MKKRLLSLLLVMVTVVVMLASCGTKNETAEEPTVEQTEEGEDTVQTDEPEVTTPDVTDPNQEEDTEDDTEVEETREGYIRSELTNEWIDEKYANIRPLAMMIPNDKAALPHYNISQAGVLYQINVEGRITRLMAIFDTWQDLGDRIGNIRSARSYYVYWALEWDPIFVHFGNPFYADAILDSGLVADVDMLNLTKGTLESAGALTESGKNAHYYRATDRKAPQNAYASSTSLINAVNYKKYSMEHTSQYQGTHYAFSNSVHTYADREDAFECLSIDFKECYPIDDTYFLYDAESETYLRYEYGEPHVDAATGEQLSFTNVLIQFTRHQVLDAKGYLDFWFKENMSEDGEYYGGYYISEGIAIPIYWEKNEDYVQTKYYDMDGNEVIFNTGKTMVCIVELDDKEKLVLE